MKYGYIFETIGIHNRLGAELGLIVRALSDTGARIREILNLRKSDLTAPDAINIIGLKGSNDRVVHDAELYAALSEFAEAVPGDGIFRISYSVVYNYILTLKVSYRPAGARNKRVTNYFRSRWVKERVAGGETLAEVAERIGHTDPRTTSVYLSF